jgi:hypothetical protein
MKAKIIVKLIERALNPDLKEAHIKAYAEAMIQKDRERVFDVYQSDTTWNEFKHIIETVPIILD